MLHKPSPGRPARPLPWQSLYLAAASGGSECGAGSSAVGLGCPALVVGYLLLRFALFCLRKVGQSFPGFNRKHFVLRREWLKATDAFLFLSICFGASSHVGAVFGQFACSAVIWGTFAGPYTTLGPVQVTCAFSRTRVLHRYRWQRWSCEHKDIVLAAVFGVFPC